MCLYPRLMKNRKYTKTKKNGGNIPPVNDERVLWVPIGCQKCIECRRQRAREWQVRLQEDIKRHTNGKFVTLTFSDESLAGLEQEGEGLGGYQLDNHTATMAVRRFLERWRKKYGKSVRHWLVTELGHKGTERIHLHGIIWTSESFDTIEKIWQYGWVWKGYGKENYVNTRTINYIVKYIIKADEKHPGYISKVLTSSGIGRGYEKEHNAKRNKYPKKTRGFGASSPIIS